MFVNSDLTEKFFDLICDSRNLYVKCYEREGDNQFGNCKFYLADVGNILINKVLQEDWDRFVELGTAISEGDVEGVVCFFENYHWQIDEGFVVKAFKEVNYNSKYNPEHVAKLCSGFVNAYKGIGEETEEFINFFASGHNTHLQGRMRLFVGFCERMATKRGDARNEGSIKLAQAVLEAIKENDIVLPYI